MTPRDPIADLQSALAFTPSPEFAARVRARVAAAPRRAPFALPRLAVVFAAAVVIVAAVTARQMRVHTGEVPAIDVAQSRPATTRAADPELSLATRLRPTSRPGRIAAGTAAAAADPFYEVLVPDDQRIALERLLESMKSGRTSVPRAAVIATMDDDGYPVLTPLPGIVPMKIEPLAGTPADAIKRETKKEP